jgi:hypothetical protein
MLAVLGIPLNDGTRSEPAVVMLLVTWLLPPLVVPPLPSFAAPVVNVSAAVPVAVGVPVTVQLMTAPTATVPVVGTPGVQLVVKPAGRPAMAQLAPMLAAAVAVLELVQV